MASLPPPKLASVQGRRQVLSRQMELQDTLDSLLRCARHGDHSAIKSKLLAARNDAQWIDDYFRTIFEPVYYNERRTKDSTIAQKVFNIPELLGIILNELDFHDLVRSSQVCHITRDVIAASSATRARLVPLPALEPKAMEYQHVDLRTGYWKFCRLPDTRSRLWRIRVRINPRNISDIPLDPNCIWNRIPICDPPIYAMQVSLECRNSFGLYQGVEYGQIESDAALTIGAIHGRAIETMKEWSKCNSLPKDDAAGDARFEPAHIGFEARLPFPPAVME